MKNHPSDITEFLVLILEALKAAGVEYLIGGAIAEWAWGEPRATQDLDLVIDLPVKAIAKFSKELEKRDMLLPAEIMMDALMEDRADIPLNAIHMFAGFKADLYLIRPGDELRQDAFRRRRKVSYGSPIGSVYIHSAEDLILYKLIYFDLSKQQKHQRDIVAILRKQGGSLELEYIEEWVSRLGFGSLWKEMLESVS